MPRPDYWLGLMRRVADEMRTLSETPFMNRGEQKMHCAKCDYVLLTTGAARHYCPNGCGELLVGADTEEQK